MPYKALKSVKFDKQYAAGSTVPDKAVAPEMAQRLEKMGIIQKQRGKDKDNFSLSDLAELINKGKISKEDMLVFAENFILENGGETVLKGNDISDTGEAVHREKKTEPEKSETS